MIDYILTLTAIALTLLLAPFAILACAALVALVIRTVRTIKRFFAYLSTRNTPPAAGQVWDQNGSELAITEVTQSGFVRISSERFESRMSWSDSPKAWRSRVRSRRLILVNPGKETT